MEPERLQLRPGVSRPKGRNSHRINDQETINKDIVGVHPARIGARQDNHVLKKGLWEVAGRNHIKIGINPDSNPNNGSSRLGETGENQELGKIYSRMLHKRGLTNLMEGGQITSAISSSATGRGAYPTRSTTSHPTSTRSGSS